MTVRRTAYVQTKREVHNPHGEVTVDVYVLWPEGHQADAAQLLREVVHDVAETIAEEAAQAS